VDQSLHYTPADLAQSLVSCSTMNEPKAVVDFCVGDGRLLAAASVRWPATDFYANDIDANVALRLGSLRIKQLTFLDFLSSSCLEEFRSSRFDVILLNPPFSTPGRKKWQPIGRYSEVDCSLSMAFVLTALSFLEEDGEILAILPASSMVSEIDRDARDIINDHFEIDVLSAPAAGLFPNISASVYTLRLINRSKKSAGAHIQTRSDSPRAPFRITRGNISVARSKRVACSSDHGWVHTTSLRDGRIIERYQRPEQCSPVARRAPPSSILIPRVGRFTEGSVVITQAHKSEIISDCLFAIECGSCNIAAIVHKMIVENFSEFRSLYIGTGAPYISIERLRQFLVRLDLLTHIEAEIAGNSCLVDETSSRFGFGQFQHVGAHF